MEFTNHLARCVAKLRLDGARGEALVRLFQEDPAGCAAEAERFWTGPHASLLVEAARSGNWSAVRTDLIALRAELVRKARRSPVALLRAALVRFLDRANRFVRPEGMSVVVLGPDGAGKSSVTTALETVRLPPVFDRSVCWGFVPPLHRLIGRNLGPSSEPHSLPARSPLNSALRATYWFLYSTVGYARVHLALARSSLVLYDRHLVDILVDPKRYRYAGPMWPMRLMWRIIPKPDLVILLDAPAEIIQARKQEVPFAETVRQREEYLELVQGLRNGRVIDASRSFDEVTNRATEIIVDFLSARTARRLRLHKEEPARPARDQSSGLRTLSQ
jgi:thymidylate kinase